MRRVLSAFPVLLLVSAAYAQSIDAPGAAQLADELSRYFGKQAIEKGVLTVTPDGDAYKLALDLNALVKMLPPESDLTLNAPPYAVRLKPLSDGTWQTSGDFSSNASFEMNGPDGPQSVQASFSGLKFDGVYDPALASFSSGTSTQDGMTMASQDPNQHVETTVGPGTAIMSAVAAPGGGVDFVTRQTITNFRESTDIDNPENGMKMPVTATSSAVTVQTKGGGVRTKAFLDLWAFAVANADEASIKAKQGELKSLLKAALPVWNRVDGAYDLKDFAVTTPVGSFNASDLGVGFGMDGVSRNGSVDYAITASGLKVPTALIPPWIVPLLPTDVDLHFGGAGIALDQIASKAIDALDLDRDPPIPPEVQDAIQAEFMAHLPKVVMHKSTVSNGGTTVTMEGEMTFPLGRPDKPDAAVTIDVKGYDKITDALQEAAKTEPQASQAFTGALMAKGFGKAMPDGSLEWAVSVKSDGSVSINGATIKGPDAP